MRLRANGEGGAGWGDEGRQCQWCFVSVSAFTAAGTPSAQLQQCHGPLHLAASAGELPTCCVRPGCALLPAPAAAGAASRGGQWGASSRGACLLLSWAGGGVMHGHVALVAQCVACCRVQLLLSC